MSDGEGGRVRRIRQRGASLSDQTKKKEGTSKIFPSVGKKKYLDIPIKK